MMSFSLNEMSLGILISTGGLAKGLLEVFRFAVGKINRLFLPGSGQEPESKCGASGYAQSDEYFFCSAHDPVMTNLGSATNLRH
jgi:hypothetical protein